MKVENIFDNVEVCWLTPVDSEKAAEMLLQGIDWGSTSAIGSSAATANVISLIFAEENEKSFSLLMRLVAVGDTEAASQLAGFISQKTGVPDRSLAIPEATAEKSKTSVPIEAKSQLVGNFSTKYSLSSSELNVLRMISQGLSNRAIAEANFRSVHTIDAQVKSIFRKLNVRTRAHAVSEAVQRRVLSPPGCAY